MKKSLLALAVLGAFAGVAQAQTGITVRGLIDVGYQSTSRQAGNAGGVDFSGINNNGSATSTLVFEGTEDLGGGLKAGFFLATDFDAGEASSTFLNSQNYLSLAGGFGSVQLGRINAQALTAATTAQPFGTAIGGGYSTAFSRLNGDVISRIIRTSNSAYYTSPNFGGFKATVGFSQKNDDVGATGANLSDGMQEFAVSYNANGLNIVLTRFQAEEGIAGGVGAVEDTHTLLGANYAFGPLTVYGGWTDSNAEVAGAPDTVDATSYNVAAKYAITPALAVMANFVRVNDKLAANVDRSLVGLGADYSLSKRTVAYVRYERQDPNKRVSNDRRSDMAIGLRHSF